MLPKHVRYQAALHPGAFFPQGRTPQATHYILPVSYTHLQAYNAAEINERIEQAVAETCGQVLLTTSGELPYAWFHAHSGGKTALAREGLGWNDPEPTYTRVTDRCV